MAAGAPCALLHAAWGSSELDEVAMSPIKQTAMGIGGCVLVPGGSLFGLKSGTQTYMVAVTVSRLCAEPSLRRLSQAIRMSCEEAASPGYRGVRSHDDAVMHGLV
jgi:hypothetical protein